MPEVSAHVVILGAGHAGGSVAALLRQYGWKGPVTLIGSEPVPAYQRPPLSKGWLKGESELPALLLRPASFYAANAIDLRLSSPATEIDRKSRTVALATGDRVAYDHLIIAAGARARMLPVPGGDLAGILELRTVADADRLKSVLRPGLRLAIVGAGYIGLEAAASARTMGAEICVIERELRVLARVASPLLSDFFQRRHEADDVRILLDAAVEAFEGAGGQVTGVRLTDGRHIPCDAALVAIGAVPNDALARAAALDCADGIIVEGEARTSDTAIRAIGDCTHRPLPRYQRAGRLESVPNALEQAKQAAASLCGRPPPAPEIPWFWSDQYDVRLQIAGLLFDVADSVVRGDPATGSFAIFHLAADGTVQSVEAVNAPRDFMAGRAMVDKRTQVAAAKLLDPSCSLRDLAA
jgi:3-phenylpropionate/trans-cinnamate dioxygenase ferredoxin reductase component